MLNELEPAVLDWVSSAHAQRLSRGMGFGPDGSETDAPATCGDLLSEFTGYRRKQTFGGALQDWLASEFDLNDNERLALLAWLDPQPLPIDQLSTLLAGVVDLEKLATAHLGIVSYEFGKSGSLPEDGTAAALIAAGAPELEDSLRQAVTTWLNFFAGIHAASARRGEQWTN